MKLIVSSFSASNGNVQHDFLTKKLQVGYLFCIEKNTFRVSAVLKIFQFTYIPGAGVVQLVL